MPSGFNLGVFIGGEGQHSPDFIAAQFLMAYLVLVTVFGFVAYLFKTVMD